MTDYEIFAKDKLGKLLGTFKVKTMLPIPGPDFIENLLIIPGQYLCAGTVNHFDVYRDKIYYAHCVCDNPFIVTSGQYEVRPVWISKSELVHPSEDCKEDVWFLTLKTQEGCILGTFYATEDCLPTAEDFDRCNTREEDRKVVLVLKPVPESLYRHSGRLYSMECHKNGNLYASRCFSADVSWGYYTEVQQGSTEINLACFRSRDLVSAPKCSCGSWITYGKDSDLCADWCDTK